MQYDYDFKDEIIRALRNDTSINFRETGSELRNGVCPNCGQKELFIRLDAPWRVKCRRLNNCNYSESTRKLYPEIFENLSKKYPSTDTDPHAAANAYMKINRGFDLEKIKGMYEQGYRKISETNFAATVRFQLWDNYYWQRLIDNNKIRENDGKKVHIYCPIEKGGYRDKAWIPPGMTFEQNDTIWITEGIFKSLAFLHINKKSIAAISANNLPREAIKENKGKNITWILAYDNDNAGMTVSEKYSKELEKLGERYLVAFPRYKSSDWDDEYRAGNLTDKYLEESIWRGYYQLADSPQKKAFFYWAKFNSHYHVFNHNNSLYRYNLDKNNTLDIEECKTYIRKWDDYNHAHLLDAISHFTSISTIEKISNCYPQFLYIERDALTEEQFYSFKFNFSSGNPETQVALDGSSLESAASFNKALLTRTPGGTFDGTAADIKKLRSGWFNKKISYIKTVPFLGYDKESKVYIFPNFAFKSGKLIDVNNDGYITAGKERIKCGFKSMQIYKPDKIDLSWINDFKDAFQFNGLVLMSWWMGTLFAEQIRAKLKSWPFLEYTGDQGAGKSTQIEFMWKCCGRDNYEGFDPSKSTHAGRSRNFQQVANLPVVLLEGDRNEAGAKKRSFDFDELKTAFNGRSIRSMGVKKRGAETEEPDFRGAIIISQNAEVEGSDALLSRIIHCHCDRVHFTDDTEIKARRLSALDTKEAAGWMQKVLQNESAVLKGFFKKFSEIEKEFKGRSNAVQNRLVLNHAQVAAWAWQLPKIFGSDVITEKDCIDIQEYIWIRCIHRQRRLQADHPIVQLFWEYYNDINEKKTSVNEIQQILNHSGNSSEIAINLTQFQELINNHNLERLPISELKSLLPLCRSHRFLGQRKIRSAITGTIKHCWIFENKNG